jgi:hypothetical protein
MRSDPRSTSDKPVAITQFSPSPVGFTTSSIYHHRIPNDSHDGPAEANALVDKDFRVRFAKRLEETPMDPSSTSSLLNIRRLVGNHNKGTQTDFVGEDGHPYYTKELSLTFFRMTHIPNDRNKIDDNSLLSLMTTASAGSTVGLEIAAFTAGFLFYVYSLC